MLKALELLPSKEIPLILFTRHSIREIVRGVGLAGYDLQLTEEGRALAFAWGKHLSQVSDRQIISCLSSPIQRCIDTAQLMIAGADEVKSNNNHEIDILQHPLLVEPGSFVVDIEQAAPYFREQGAVGFINSFVQNALPGMKQPVTGVLDVLRLLHESYMAEQIQPSQLSLAVSHDTILAAFIAVISGHFQVETKDWPEMMEGIFIWFEQAECFEKSCVNWIWRGQLQQLDIQTLVNDK